jgi:hypothetical protein
LGSGIGVGWYDISPGAKPEDGRSCPEGGLNLNDSPEGSFSESVTGLKESFPENAMAVTIVGEARKFIVRPLPSLRDLKFLITKCQAVAPKGKEALPVE